MKMARWDGLRTERGLAVTEQGNLEEGRPRISATWDTSELLVLARHKVLSA